MKNYHVLNAMPPIAYSLWKLPLLKRVPDAGVTSNKLSLGNVSNNASFCAWSCCPQGRSWRPRKRTHITKASLRQWNATTHHVPQAPEIAGVLACSLLALSSADPTSKPISVVRLTRLPQA